MPLKKQDSQIYELIEEEKKRQKEGLELIASESYASSAVLESLGSVLNNKYAENYPGKRYYGGCRIVDMVENLCKERAREVFKADDYHVNVQPYSGSPANLAVYIGLLDFKDTIMAMRLDHGGHLTHGNPMNLSGRAFNFVHYGINSETETLDYNEILKLAKQHKPKIILSGFTAYPRTIDFKKIDEIAKEVKAISMADISHISGLIIGKVHPSPFPFTDVVTTTTHKTLCGPRGAIILCKKEYGEKIDKGVFPGLQGGPHEHAIAGIAVALKQAQKPEFEEFAKQIVRNAKVLAETLISEKLKLVSNGTDNHLMVVDLTPFGKGKGVFAEKALETAGISVSKSTTPNDKSVPYYPSGLRIGTPAVTSRGMKEKEMETAGKLIAKVIKEFLSTNMPDTKEERNTRVKEFKEEIKNSLFLKEVKEEVKNLASPFPVPGIDDK
ncbi:MAG: serine hydroxymethyltransferase [Candidatus Pacebacteria bacterium]|jgi:glycine hydroxymethyltransferase|nr:serine hydroxymethyltransferase [Candidatus Paceibacterota bacterium]MDD4897216.1 serine hydroxymethyltransferase [Candidatus Paceibacterota bacterium]